MSSRNTVRVVGWTAAGLVAAGAVGAGVAYAADPSPSGSGTPTPSASSSDTTGPGGRFGLGGRHGGFLGHRADGLAGRAMHGELVVKDRGGKPVTVDVQRGSVTAVSASSITLRSDDGFTATYTITSDTRVRIDEKGSTTAEVRTGDTAVVTARKSGDTATAQLLVVRQ
jgi:hypothetical protein